MAKQQSNQQSGAVSIFAVIFAAMLLTILTVGFIKLMVRDQQQASNNDLSQSAYDSAMAGVEDAKRLIKRAHEGDINARTALADHASDCRVIALGGVSGLPGDEETIIETSQGDGGGDSYNQAYTCVKIDMLTNDYLYEATESKSQLIPLKSDRPYDKVVIEWLAEEDLGAGATVTAPPDSGSDLPAKDSWGVDTPPVIRAQLITPGKDFAVGELDSSEASQTIFLQPAQVMGGSLPVNPSIDVSPGARSRATSQGAQFDNKPDQIICSENFAYTGGYACRAELDLGREISVEDSETAFIRLNTIYRGATVRVQLVGSDGGLVKFNGVQPAVDSTGRASNLFRRVEARLRIGDDFPYPNGSIDVASNLCKNFSVIDTGAILPASPDDSCEP